MRGSRKVVVAAVLVAAALVPLAALGGTSSTAGTQAAKSLKISYQVPALKFPFFLFQKHFLEKAATKFPGVKIVTADALNSAATQTQNMEAAISQKVDGIIISPLTEEQLVPAVNEATKAGIPVVTIDRAIKGGNTLAHVGADNVAVGRAAARYVVRKLHGKGRVILLEGTPGASAAIDRTTGIKQVLKAQPGIKVVFDQSAEFDRTKGLNVTEDAIRAVNKQFDALLAENDDMALGAIEALKSAGLLGKVLVVGTDAIPDALKAIEAGTLDATVEQFGDKQAAQALKIIVDFLRTGRKPAHHTTLIKPLLISKANLSQAVVKK